jgi:hypothetical protein
MAKGKAQKGKGKGNRLMREMVTLSGLPFPRYPFPVTLSPLPFPRYPFPLALSPLLCARRFFQRK